MFMWTQFAHFQNILEDTRDTGRRGTRMKGGGWGDEEKKEGEIWALKMFKSQVSRRNIKPM
jgi:hypothetical protein